MALGLSLGLLAADGLRWPSVEKTRSTLYDFFEPVYVGLSWPGALIEEVSDSLRFGSSLRSDNDRLRQQNLMLAAQVQKLSYLAGDNARLRGLLAASEGLRSRVLVSEVIGVDPDPSRHVMIINQGRDAGIYRGQAVLDAQGVFGRVIQVGQRTSRVMLVADRLHSVPVRINRNGIRAILSGTGDLREMRLQYVPEKSDVKQGDLLVTSGLGIDFPAGYPVGRVTEVIRQTDDDQFLNIIAEPVATLDRSRYVLALFEKPQSAEHLHTQPLNADPVFPAPVTPPAPATPVQVPVDAAAPADTPAVPASPATPAPAVAAVPASATPAVLPPKPVQSPATALGQPRPAAPAATPPKPARPAPQPAVQEPQHATTP